MSRSRPRVLSRCSLKICSGVLVVERVFPRQVKVVGQSPPQSANPARASPGGGTAARTREMRRSELVTVPSFSAQLAAGSSTSA